MVVAGRAPDPRRRHRFARTVRRVPWRTRGRVRRAVSGVLGSLRERLPRRTSRGGAGHDGSGLRPSRSGVASAALVVAAVMYAACARPHRPACGGRSAGTRPGRRCFRSSSSWLPMPGGRCDASHGPVVLCCSSSTTWTGAARNGSSNCWRLCTRCCGSDPTCVCSHDGGDPRPWWCWFSATGGGSGSRSRPSTPATPVSAPRSTGWAPTLCRRSSTTSCSSRRCPPTRPALSSPTSPTPAPGRWLLRGPRRQPRLRHHRRRPGRRRRPWTPPHRPGHARRQPGHDR